MPAATAKIIVGIENTTGGTYGDVYMWGRSGVQNWIAQGLGDTATPYTTSVADPFAVAFSPNYPIDATILAVAANGTSTYLYSRVSTNAWNSIWSGNTPVTVQAGTTDAEMLELRSRRLAIGTAGISTLQRMYVAVVSSDTDNVYRITGTTTGVALNPASGDQEYTSVVYNGTYNTRHPFRRY